MLAPIVATTLLFCTANRCYPPVAEPLNIPHESINASAGERIRDPLHLQDGQQPRFLKALLEEDSGSGSTVWNFLY